MTDELRHRAPLDRSDAVNLARNVICGPDSITDKGIRCLAVAVLRMDAALRVNKDAPEYERGLRDAARHVENAPTISAALERHNKGLALSILALRDAAQSAAPISAEGQIAARGEKGLMTESERVPGHPKTNPAAPSAPIAKYDEATISAAEAYAMDAEGYAIPQDTPIAAPAVALDQEQGSGGRANSSAGVATPATRCVAVPRELYERILIAHQDAADALLDKHGDEHRAIVAELLSAAPAAQAPNAELANKLRNHADLLMCTESVSWHQAAIDIRIAADALSHERGSE